MRFVVLIPFLFELIYIVCCFLIDKGNGKSVRFYVFAFFFNFWRFFLIFFGNGRFYASISKLPNTKSPPTIFSVREYGICQIVIIVGVPASAYQS